MNRTLIDQVKNSLAKQFYTMNDSWLTDCIEYYLNDHENSTHEDIITFVTNQWLLCDLREINNEKGCLPPNLTKQKCTLLSGKYILQMDKIYDISTSKYKQLEKIRNVSSENIEATEFENALQEDKSQIWEPKSKRMLQLFLTDGIQDILAIEYKPIKFLKNNLYPGFKIMIKGPVICRKGVILLEEKNFAEIGGEVENLLIPNAVENIFARALNLEENPDPYNDNNKQSENSQNTQKINQMEDDFDLDSEAIDQIDKQIQQQNSNNSNKSNIVVQKSNSNEFFQSVNKNNEQSIPSTNKFTNAASSNFGDSRNNYNNRTEQKNASNSVHNNLSQFENDDDSFLEMIDENALDKFSSDSTVQYKSFNDKDACSLSINKNQNTEDFLMENNIHDIVETQNSVFNTIQVQQHSPKLKSKLSNKPSSSKILMDKFPSPLKSKDNIKSIVNKFDEFPDDNFDFDDFDIRNDSIENFFNKSSKSNSESSQVSSTRSLKIRKDHFNMDHIPYKNTNNSNSSSLICETKLKDYKVSESLENQLDNKFDMEYELQKDIDCKKMLISKQKVIVEKPRIEKIYTTSPDKPNNQANYSSNKQSSTGKRPSSSLSPITNAHKVRCLQSPTTSTRSKSFSDISENCIQICEFLCDVLEEPLQDECIRRIVRGRVVKVIKLNLLKGESGSYFHLDGTITDDTASLDVVFSSKVLEKIIGYTPQEFSKKRRESKTNPMIKDQLRDNLNKAQQAFRFMDALMEIEFQKTKKALVINTEDLTDEQIKEIDSKVKALKREDE